MSTEQRTPCVSAAKASYYRALPAGAAPEPLHTHSEPITVQVLEGVVYLISPEDERPMTPGDEATIPAGEPHRLFNAGDEEAHVLEGARPANCRALTGRGVEPAAAR